MAEKIKLVQGDNAPDLYVTLVNSSTNTKLNVSTASVVMKFREQYGTELKAEITGTKPNGGSDGVVSFTWPDGALDTAGNFEGEIEITYQDGKIQTIYEVLKFIVRNQF
jgi:glutamine phosphoribosylpyrophosphate amidotransferase